MSPSAFAAQAAACTGHDALDRLAGIAVPTLVTAGDEDVFTPPRCARQLADGIPGARLEVFAGAAHTHHWERLDEFNALVEEWLG
jgi:pimeloyl-ACP methyl ester carboxylesterase